MKEDDYRTTVSKLEKNCIMTESNVNSECLIEIRDEEENGIATNNVNSQTLSEYIRNEDQVIAYSILGKLRLQAPSPPSACVYRIPDLQLQKRLHEKDFVPSLVSIGPFHHGKKNLQAMERMKLWYLRNLLIRKATPETNMEHIVEKIRSMEEYCRDCYDEKIDLSSAKFVEMLVVDGFFIIELFRKMIGDMPRGVDDPLFNRSGMLSIVQNDLLLLENQLPWRVLDCLFHQVPGGKCKSLWELTQRILPSWRGLEYFVSHVPNTLQSRHLLDTLRILSVEFESDKNEKVCPFRVRIPSVTELLQVGVKFRRKRGFDSILNITLLDGVMEIAPITLDAEKSVFRNLIALEEYEPRHHKYQITSYARVMHDLINSSKDVEFLMQKGIINTISLRKEDIVYFFNTILDDSNTVSSCSSIVLLSAGVTEYYDHRWLRRWIASIKGDYLYNPSSIWSISNAVVFITILTIIQTVYSVLSYYKS